MIFDYSHYLAEIREKEAELNEIYEHFKARGVVEWYQVFTVGCGIIPDDVQVAVIWGNEDEDQYET